MTASTTIRRHPDSHSTCASASTAQHGVPHSSQFHRDEWGPNSAVSSSSASLYSLRSCESFLSNSFRTNSYRISSFKFERIFPLRPCVIRLSRSAQTLLARSAAAWTASPTQHSRSTP